MGAPPRSFVYCSTRFCLTWLVITTVTCFLYALIVFVSLVDKTVLPSDEGPDAIPYINVPNKYDVSLDFQTASDKSNETYSGTVQMSFTARDSSQRIYLHAGTNLRLGSHTLSDGDRKVNLRRGVYNAQTEIQTFIPSANLTLNVEYVLEVSFVGKMNAVKGGPRQFTYTTDRGETRYGVSFASPSSARGLRLLFPCLDGRDYPAIFDLSIRRHESFRTISNYPTTNIDSRGPYMLDAIDARARLYPYQLGLVLCDFPYKRETINNLVISVYYRPTALDGISIRRLQQFMDKTSAAIGKIDAVVLADVPTTHQPGLSLLNEQETVTENNELAAIRNQTRRR